MVITEHELRKIIRYVILEHAAEDEEEEKSSEDEEPIGEEGRIKTVYTIAKEIGSFL